jgi:SAM-dependent methyltransferase
MKTSKIYLSDKHALAFYREKATAEFWDKHWETDQLQAIIRKTTDDGLFIPLMKKYLPRESIVLEGGCGMGQIVHALQYQGYKAIGIDYAVQTVQKVKEAVPELDVRLGDVFALDIPDESLDGYISVGVIEHFWNGYAPIINEMKRTLRPGGFLFVSFPYMSPLRRLKVFLKRYPMARKQDMEGRVNAFYQFALSPSCVQSDLELLGFQMRDFLTYGGLKGFKDEVSLVRPLLQEIYDGRRAGYLWGYLDRLFKPFASHSVLLVMQKVK